jgi:hypothetical protein
VGYPPRGRPPRTRWGPTPLLDGGLCYGRRVCWIWGRRRAATLVVSTVAVAIALTATAAAQPSPSKALLTPAQVGPGYTEVSAQGTSPGISESGCAGHPIKSASLEVAHRAEVYLDSKNSADPLVANVIISYRPGAASMVLSELRDAAQHCSQPSLLSPASGGGKLHIALVSVPDLTPRYLALEASQTFTDPKRAVATYAVAELQGNALSLVTGTGISAVAVRPATVRSVVFHAARESAHNFG